MLVVLIGLLAAGIAWDYGIQKNFGTVVPGKIYRSGQPSEAQLDKWIQEYGFKSILVHEIRRSSPTRRNSQNATESNCIMFRSARRKASERGSGKPSGRS